MRRATISQAKNGLSALLEQVKAGDAVLITDRGVPVARIEPVTTSPDPTGRSQRLAQAGLVTPGSGVMKAELLAAPTERAPSNHRLVDAVIEERRSGW